MGVSFVDCPPDRLASLRSFFGEMYWPDYILSRDETFLKWQFGVTPASQQRDYHIILGLVDDDIKGCVGYIPVELSLAGRAVTGAWAANWMVDDKVRRLGLGPLLMRELTKRFEVTLALGGNRDAHDLLPRMGWKDFGDLARYVCVVDVDAAAQLTETGKLDWPVHSFRRRTAGPGTVSQVERFDDDVTALWQRTWGGSAAGTCRSGEFLNWRYADHPNFSHRLFAIRDAGGLKGIAVNRIEQVRDMPVRVGRILELVAEDDYAPALARAVVEDARAQGVAALDFFCASRRLDAVMREEGFLPGEQAPGSGIPILFQPLDRERTGILFMAHLQKAPGAAGIAEWYVTKSDGDQDRPA